MIVVRHSVDASWVILACALVGEWSRVPVRPWVSYLVVVLLTGLAAHFMPNVYEQERDNTGERGGGR